VSRLYLAGLAGALRREAAAARFVLDCDENDVAAQQSIARMHRRNGAADRAEWAMAEADAFAALARRSLAEFDVAFMASRGDALSLAQETGYGRLVVVPNAVSTTAQRPARIAGSAVRTVLFVGTLGYEPNADAVGWFASRVWPRLSSTMPGRLRLVVAGSGAPARIQRLSGQPGIAVTGFARDLGSLYRKADLAIAPLRAGGGTRIKLLEAAVHGVPSVATRLGAEGLDLRPGRDIMLADGAGRFAGACAMLLTDAALARRMAGNARRRVRSGHDRARWAARLGDFALQLTAESYIPPSPVHGLGLTNV
jgi:glycosyltransferase involved in cell wall biosynthesis